MATESRYMGHWGGFDRFETVKADRKQRYMGLLSVSPSGLHQVTVTDNGVTIYQNSFSRLETAEDDLRCTLASYRDA